MAVPNPQRLAFAGPVDPVHGFPMWFEDAGGLRLELVLDADPLAPAIGELCRNEKGHARRTAVIELLLGNDGHYQRSYRPQAYFGMVYDTGTWVSANGALQLRWTEYTVIPKPAYPPLQQGTDTFVVEADGPDAFRFRSPACDAPQCWGRMVRVQ